MKIDFILSDTTKSATSNALKCVADDAKKDIFSKNIVIVPETKSIIIEKELLNLSSSGAFINVFVYSFVRLLDRMGNVPYDKIMSKQSLVILLRRIISDNFDNLVCYKKIAKTVGFAEKIYDTIAQLKSSGISVEDLRKSLETSDVSLKQKMTDILLIYEEYEKMLGNDFYDDCDKLNLVSTFAKDNKLLKGSNVYIVGFDNITSEMECVIRDIAKNCSKITFSAVYFNNAKKNGNIQNNELFSKFKRIADSLNYPYFPRFFPSDKKGDFAFVRDNLFSGEKVGKKADGSVTVFEAKSSRIELDYVASTIISEINAGKRYGDIGLMVCGLEDKLNIIEDCFRAYGIKYYVNIDRKTDLHPLVRFISGAFELVSSNLKNEKVLNFVSNPLFGAKNYSLFYSYVSETGASYNDFTNQPERVFLEKYVKKHIKSDEKIEKIDIDNLIVSSKELEEFSSDWKTLQCFYTGFSKIVLGAVTGNDFILAIDYIVDFFGISDKLVDIAISQKQFGLETDGEVSKIIFKKWQNLRSQISNFLGNINMTFQEFVLIFKSGFSSMKINLSPVSADCVIVQNNTDGFFGIKDLFILGADEDNFPVKLADCGIISDSELEETKMHIGKTIEPKVRDINRREKFRVYEALLEPSEKLFISYSLKGIDGSNSKQSKIVSEIIKLLGDGILKKTYFKPDFVNFEIYEREFVNEINKFYSGKSTPEKIGQMRSNLGDKIDKKVKAYIENELTGRNFTILQASDLYFYNDNTSITQLQKYFSCPYSFFVNYGLKIKETEDSKLSSSNIGTIIHRVAELFTKDIEKTKDMTEKEVSDFSDSLLRQAIDENNFLIEKNKSLFNLLEGECRRLCSYLKYEQENSNFKFERPEYSFEKENSIELDVGGRKIFISGKIDRIDKYQDYVRVIDYKTGDISDNFSTIYYGNKIQLIVYLQAIKKVNNENKVAGLYYFPIHSEFSDDEKEKADTYKMEGFTLDDADIAKNMDLTLSDEKKTSNFVKFGIGEDKKTGELKFLRKSEKIISDKDFENLEEYVKNLSENAVGEILEGYIEPSPIEDDDSQTPKECSYCPARGFCGLDKARFPFGRKIDKKIDVSSFYKK